MLFLGRSYCRSVGLFRFHFRSIKEVVLILDKHSFGPHRLTRPKTELIVSQANVKDTFVAGCPNKFCKCFFLFKAARLSSSLSIGHLQSGN